MAIVADWSNIPLVEFDAARLLALGADKLIEASNTYCRKGLDVGPNARFWNTEGEDWVRLRCKAYAAAMDAEDEPAQQELARRFVAVAGTLATVGIRRVLSEV